VLRGAEGLERPQLNPERVGSTEQQPEIHFVCAPLA
jgi:hypothetical protein